LFFSGAGKARDLGLQSSLVLGMADSVDDGVVDGIALGEEGTPDGEEGSDHVGEVHAGEVDYAIWCPRDEPQGYIHKCNLSQLALVGSLLAFFVTERFDSHLLCLFLHSLLVLENLRDNLGVSSNNVKKREEPHESSVAVQVGVGLHSWAQIVSSAGSQVTLRNISIPAEERKDSPND